jgi:hypothetical protein
MQNGNGRPHYTATGASLHAAIYALILRQQGLAPDEIRETVLERYGESREVRVQLRDSEDEEDHEIGV